jgi:hypothetical protein
MRRFLNLRGVTLLTPSSTGRPMVGCACAISSIKPLPLRLLSPRGECFRNFKEGLMYYIKIFYFAKSILFIFNN